MLDIHRFIDYNSKCRDEDKQMKFKKGQKVKNRYGKVLTVQKQVGCQVFVYEDILDWYHPDKLFKV